MHFQKIYQFMALLTAASSVLSFPTAAYRSLDSFSGENGLYRVSIARDGTHSAIFTPLAGLNLTAAVDHSVAPVERATDAALEKRQGVAPLESPIGGLSATCDGTRPAADDVNGAQAGLRVAADLERVWYIGHIAFVRFGNAIAYACCYDGPCIVDGGLLNSIEVYIDNIVCGWPNGGWGSDNGQLFDMNVGRTVFGHDSCEPGVIGH